MIRAALFIDLFNNYLSIYWSPDKGDKLFICQDKREKFKITWGTCRIKVACLILFLNWREGRGEGEKGSQRKREGKEEEGKREVEEEEELLSKFWGYFPDSIINMHTKN